MTRKERRVMAGRAAAVIAMNLALVLERDGGMAAEAEWAFRLAGKLRAGAGSVTAVTEGDGLRKAADLIDRLDYDDETMRATGGEEGESDWPVEVWDDDGRQWTAKRLFPGAFKSDPTGTPRV